MNKTVLISLISEQTIPNVLFIKQFDIVDKYIFITTERMENEENGNRRNWILKACNIDDNKQQKIEVNAEDKINVEEKLSKFNFSEFERIIVNITGGTKMMSIAAYEFFNKNYPDAELWYKPIDKKDEYHICNKPNKTLKINYNLTVKEYLEACGIFEDRYSFKKPVFDESYCIGFFQLYINNDNIRKLVEKIRILFRANNAPYSKQMKKKDKIDLTLSDDLSEILIELNKIKFPLQEDKILTKTKMEFLTGGWFEEYVYYKIKKKNNLSENSINLGVFLNPKPKDKERLKYFANNDLDVVYVKNNEFYVIECKTDITEQGLFNETVYKMAALRKYFGLSVKSVLATLSDLNEEKIEKASVFQIQIIDKL
jgi:hypothetical protein